MADLLTREHGLLHNTAPTGRVLGYEPLPQNPSMLVIKFTDGKGGEVPETLGGLWTSPRQAQEAIQDYLIKFWNISDSAAAESKVKKVA